MALFVDARIPVVFAPAGLAGDDDALLLGADANEALVRAMPTERLDSPAAAIHPADCSCCMPRSTIGRRLSGLFIARGRGEVGFFRRVVVATDDPAAREAVRAAVAQDPLASSLFRLDEP